MSAVLDGRDQAALRAQLLRRAAALLGPDGAPVEPGKVETAIIGAAARIFEEVTRRIDKVPEKQADNFYAAMGIGRDPAIPARLPVAITLADTASDGLFAPAGTRFTADTVPTPTIFETANGIALARGKVAKLVAADLNGDAIMLAPQSVVSPTLPPPTAVARVVRSGAGAGATMVQVDPSLGLAPGMTIRFVRAGTPEYDITAVKNDVVSFVPALAGTIAAGDAVIVVDDFAPFASGARNRQGHALYLSHPTLLDVEAALTLTVVGVEAGQVMLWEWFGAGPDGSGPAWQTFDPAVFAAGRWSLSKPKGKPEKTEIDGRNALWIRARLEGGSGASARATDISLAVSSGTLCASDHTKRCTPVDGQALPEVAYDAVAVTTPVVPNKPYYPFGREPRLYDSFYVGCAEAFGKAGAEVSLCLALGGASLERIAVAAGRQSTYVFGLGTDHQLYAARFATGTPGATPDFSVVPGPRDGDRPAELPDQPQMSLRIDGEWVRIVIGGIGAVYVSQFLVGTPWVEGAITWLKLDASPDDKAVPSGAIFAGEDAASRILNGSIDAMFGTRLHSWKRDSGGMLTLQPVEEAIDLIPVQNADAALMIVPEGNKWRVRVRSGSSPLSTDSALLDPGDLPADNRAAWMSSTSVAGDRFFVAGYDAGASTDGNAEMGIAAFTAASVRPIVKVASCPPLPIAFEPPLPSGDTPPSWPANTPPPMPVIATAQPLRFVFRGDAFAQVGGVADIGDSANPVRRIVFGGGLAVVQHWDRGLLYRPATTNGLEQRLRFNGAPCQVADGRDILPNAVYVIDEQAPNGRGFLIANNSGDRLLLALTDRTNFIDPTHDAIQLGRGSETGTLDLSGASISLIDSLGNASAVQRDVDLFLSIGGEPKGIWQLRYDSTGMNWDLPAASPPLPNPVAGADIDYQLLDPLGSAPLRLRDYFRLERSDAISLDDRLGAGPLRSLYADTQVTRIENFDSTFAIRIDRDLTDGTMVRLVVPPTGWTPLGPSEPANPALSWEYWNGASWWALDTDAFGFSDRTANLQISQGVYFRAPADLRETEVGGRKNLWIRARLVGGDFGEARVTVTSVDRGGGKTEQTVARDLSAIRAPYVISLKINYCVTEPVKPAIVITADNLGTIDQTNANEAGLPVTIFATAAEALAPPPSDDQAEKAPPDCCHDRPEAVVAKTAGASLPAATVARGLLVGFDQPITGSPLSLFVNADAHANRNGSWRVEAALYRAGRFETAKMVYDGTSGLGESGVIAVEVLRPPDRASLFGSSAFWLRLSPGDEAGDWSPKIRGIHLNGAIALSIETRANETIGTSSGAPDQQFRLFAAPVDPESLKLQVAEPIGEDEAAALGADADVVGMPGPWVVWKQVDEFSAEDTDDPARLYTIDAESGVVTFGNGRNALVPPMGSAILARAYHHVIGSAANGVAGGAKLQPVSAIAGIDGVVALDGAVGGADVEAERSARLRAPAKLANGGRIVTLADLESHVRARNPMIAQVRAENRGGGVRLIVVGTGDRRVPAPSALREIARELHDVASFSITAPGRLAVVGPRLLPIALELYVEPDPDADFTAIGVAAKAAIVALLDPQSGGFDGRGWPVGRLPGATDIAAALAALGDRAVIGDIAIYRANRAQAMPDPFPGDVLVGIDSAAIAVRLFEGVPA